MHHIIYLSKAIRELQQADIMTIVAHARHSNAAHHITGALVYGNGQFLQIIEGKESAVRALYTRLEHDPRHTQLIKFADKPIPMRSFAEWTMAFEYVSSKHLSTLSGITPLQEFDWLPPGLLQTDQVLMQTMRSFIVPPALVAAPEPV